MRFVALDFETASERPDSACQIGIAVYEEAKLVFESVDLIRPPSLYFSPRCIAVHGIRPSDVVEALTFDGVWEKHQHIFEGYPIIAHNAAFDLNVLCAAMSAYGLPCPYMEYSCSRLIARRAWPGRTSYALKSAADILGFEFKHHDALEDAKACAQIVLAAARDYEAQSLEAMEAALAIDRGRVQFGVRISPKGRSKKSASQSKRKANGHTDETVIDARNGRIENQDHESLAAHESIEPSRLAANVARTILQACGEVKPLSGKHVVLAGRLLGLDRPSAVAFLEHLGGSVQSQINMQTQFVIVGTGENSSCDTRRREALSDQQLDEVSKRSSEGQAIRLLSQRQLLALIPGGSAVARAHLEVS